MVSGCVINYSAPESARKLCGHLADDAVRACASLKRLFQPLLVQSLFFHFLQHAVVFTEGTGAFGQQGIIGNRVAATSVGVGHKPGAMPHRHYHGFGHTAEIGAFIEIGGEAVFVVDEHIVVPGKLFQLHGSDGIVAVPAQNGKGIADGGFLGFRGIVSPWFCVRKL